MCFTLPQKIKKFSKDKVITNDDQTLDPSLISVKIGDWVLAQNGLVIAKISEKQAKDIFQLINLQRSKAKYQM